MVCEIHRAYEQWGREDAAVYCCQTRDDTNGLVLGEQRKKQTTVGSLPGFSVSLVLEQEVLP